MTEGDTDNTLLAAGIDFASWTADSELTITDGAIFTKDPSSAPSGQVTVAQITVPNNALWEASSESGANAAAASCC